MSMNLRHMGFNEALDAAKQRSGLTNEAIANRSSLSTAAVSRYFNKYDDYAVADGELSPSEAATIQAQFRANAKWNNEAADALDPLAGGQVYRHGYGFVTVPVLDGRPR